MLIDEAVTDRLAALISDHPSLNVEYVRKLRIKGAKDQPVIDHASADQRIVFTTDEGMNERRHKPCTHKGIIILACASRYEPNQAEIFKRFLLSGIRAKARDSVTHITEREIRIVSHAGEETFPLN